MTKLTRILMLTASTCLILLLAASFAMAADDLPSDEAIIKAVMKTGYSYFVKKGGTVAGKFKKPDGSYLVFIQGTNGTFIQGDSRIYRLDSGKWMLCIYSATSDNVVPIE